jgi:hypothetical protein
MTALLLFAAGVALGFLVDRWREHRLWSRLVETMRAAPMSTEMPTLTELRTPDWGPNLVDCPVCPGAAMSQAALNEHLRVRHGDS